MLVVAMLGVVFLIANMFGIKILWAMMQNGGAFDVVFGWGRFRDRLYASVNPTHRLLENAIGGCEQCTSFWWTPVFFAMYYGLCKLRFGWVSDGMGVYAGVAVTLIVFIAYWVIGAGISHYYLTYKHKQDGV